MRGALFAFLAGAALAVPAVALDVPYLSGRVNDNARLLDARTAQNLELKLKDYEQKTGRQFAILTIPSLEGDSLEGYSLKVARTWQLGRKGQDDGILLLIARDDRKIRIEVGYGLEGALPDALCGRVIRDDIVPRFRGGDYAGGVAAGVDSILAALPGSSASRFGPRIPTRSIGGGEIVKLLLFSFMLLQSAFQAVFGLSSILAFLPFLFMDFLVSFVAASLWGFGTGVILFVAVAFLIPVLGWIKAHTDWGRDLAAKVRNTSTTPFWFGSSSGSGGGFSGGGGSFGGGGSSGSW